MLHIFNLFKKLSRPLWGDSLLVKKIRRVGGGGIKPIRQLYFYLFDRSKPESCVVNGYQIFIHPSDKAITHDLLVKGIYEENITNLFKTYVKKGMTVLDIGANIGYFTLLASSLVGPKGMVYAFEPDPSNIRLLEKNVKANNLNNIKLVDKAVSNRSDKCNLYMPDKNNRGSFTLFPNETNDYIEIESIRLDEYFKDNQVVDFVKMDIEGSEILALDGMRILLKSNYSTKMVIEFCDELLSKTNHSANALIKKLKSFGFEIYVVKSKGDIEPINKFDIDKLAKIGANLFCQKS